MTQDINNKVKIQNKKIIEKKEPVCADQLIKDIEKLLEGIRLESAINLLKIVSLRLEIQSHEKAY